jgi:hypothetical protein
MRGLGPVISLGHPFVGQEETAGGVGRHEKEADLGPSDLLDLRAIHTPDFPACSDLEYRGGLGISRQDYRKISSVGSLLFRNIPSSHTHVVPHSRIYKV